MPCNQIGPHYLRAGRDIRKARPLWPRPVRAEKLFTMFPAGWHGVERTDRGYRVPKLVWGSKVVDLRAEVEAGFSTSLTITGRRLDAESGPLVDWSAATAYIDPVSRTGFTGTFIPIARIDKGEFFITSSFHIPAPDCWEVTGHFHGEDLKVVIDIK